MVRGDDGMTLIVLSGGRGEGTMGVPKLMFETRSRSCPIGGLKDNVPCVTYRSAAKRWMDSGLFVEWKKEPRVLQKFPDQRKRILFVDNCPGHKFTVQVKKHSREAVQSCVFPACATGLVRAADFFVMQRINME